MKEFKLIEKLSEDEFEDLMFFKTDIPKCISKLKYEVSAIVNPYFNRNIPHVLVFKDNSLDFLNYTNYSYYAIIKLSPTPYTIRNDLNIHEDDLIDIFEFVKINKNILMKYWNWKCSSFELKDNIKGNK